MAQNRSREDLIRFLEYLGDKGLIAKATASARRTAAARVLEGLSDEEAADVTRLDIDELMTRFDNLNPRQFTPDSLKTYRSRLNKALIDFRAYVDDPVSFKPKGLIRLKRSPKEKSGPVKKPPSVSPGQGGVTPPSMSELPGSNMLPIPLRQNLIVKIYGLPFDLSELEAKKISNIVLAHALPQQ